jgi:dethiobiotin synthetase
VLRIALDGRPLLVTATDTGAGKTVVAAGLAALARRHAIAVRAIKPVESGCADAHPTALEDGVMLASAAGQAAPLAALDRLRAPLAPPLAAAQEGRQLDAASWLQALAHWALPSGGLLLIEGAGGLLSPLTWDFTALDLARAIGARVVLVVPDRLGSLSHARLAAGALRAARVPLEALVWSSPAQPDSASGSNCAALARCEPWLAARQLVLPRLPMPSPTTTATALTAAGLELAR